MSIKTLCAAICLFSLTAAFSLAAPETVQKLSEADAAQLQKDKVIITGKSYRQIFQPYVFSKVPVFITSDSLLNGWFVLLEETMAALEDRFAAQLPRALDAALESIKEPPDGMAKELFEKAARHARIVAGTAAKLAGGKWSSGPELDGIIAAEAQRVEAATGLYLPDWLARKGGDIAALDYTAFKPLSFYARSPRLSRYFRAVRWMQSIPFRVESDVEMAAFFVLRAVLVETQTVFSISETHEFLAGRAADVDLRAFEHMQNSFPVAFQIDTMRGQLSHALSQSSVGGTAKPHAVILAARALPDGELFHRTTSPARPLPSGLDAAAGMGFRLAGDLLSKSETNVLSEIEKWRGRDRGRATLYRQCFDALGLLSAPPEPGAPAFMHSDAWRRKSLNTALGGWAQLRHAWALQGKEDCIYFGTGKTAPGFVEPNPEFFRRTGLLIGEAARTFGKEGALEETPSMLEEYAGEILPGFEQVSARVAERIRALEDKYKGREKFTDSEQETIQKEYAEATALPPSTLEDLKPIAEVMDGVQMAFNPMQLLGINDQNRALMSLRELAAGKRRPQLAQLLGKSSRRSLRDRWDKLLEICHRLETLAHKQLRGIEPAEDETNFIKNYGPRLGGVMFYDGNSWEVPRDDAPRIASVFNQPGVAHLMAGVGRPREIRVLYPWKGKEIECRGAVMPYYEFKSDRHLSDVEWKGRLDAAGAPGPLVLPVTQ